MVWVCFLAWSGRGLAGAGSTPLSPRFLGAAAKLRCACWKRSQDGVWSLMGQRACCKTSKSPALGFVFPLCEGRFTFWVGWLKVAQDPAVMGPPGAWGQRPWGALRHLQVLLLEPGSPCPAPGALIRTASAAGRRHQALSREQHSQPLPAAVLLFVEARCLPSCPQRGEP